MTSDLHEKIENLAKLAAHADIARGGGIEVGLLVASLLAKALQARQDGKTWDEFRASLDDADREWLLGK